jgi:hypothetical protein
MSEASTVESNGTDDVAGGTGLSGASTEQRLVPHQRLSAAHLMRADGRRAHTGTPDKEQ